MKPLQRQKSRRAKATRPSFLASLTRSQAAAAAASVVDFGVLVASVEWMGLWYVTGTAVGAFMGALTNFLLGRHWSFRATAESMRIQAIRYGGVSLGSLVLNSVGVFVVTEYARVPYQVSKLVVALLIGIFFNFPLHRKFVFRYPRET